MGRRTDWPESADPQFRRAVVSYELAAANSRQIVREAKQALVAMASGDMDTARHLAEKAKALANLNPWDGFFRHVLAHMGPQELLED